MRNERFLSTGTEEDCRLQWHPRQPDKFSITKHGMEYHLHIGDRMVGRFFDLMKAWHVGARRSGR